MPFGCERRTGFPTDISIPFLPASFLHIADQFSYEFRKVAAALCVGLAETLSKVGPAFIENSK
jgi:hypothetical protein